MDLVESVRHMELQEIPTIQRWREFLHHAEKIEIPERKGRLVKSTGDGFVAEFASPSDAVGVAVKLQQFFQVSNGNYGVGDQLYLRAGVHSSHVFHGNEPDIFGTGVNLAARIAGLAGPGEIIVTAQVRDELIDGIDPPLVDLGEAFLKHVAQPVRTYRVDTPATQGVTFDRGMRPKLDYDFSAWPKVAVLPFENQSLDGHTFDIGDLIADGVIARLGKSSFLRVVSRLSSSRLQRLLANEKSPKQHLDCDYLVTGKFLLTGEGSNAAIIISASLVTQKDDYLTWTDRYKVPLQDLLELDSEACGSIAEAVQQAMVQTAASKVNQQPLPTVESYSLMLSGISLMHRSTARELEQSRKILGELTDRHPNAGDAHAWLAKSYVINAVSNYSRKDEQAVYNQPAKRALSICRASLSRANESALSLAVMGHISTHLDGNPQQAERFIQDAIALNPNEPLAWLFKSVLSAMWGDVNHAVSEAEHAIDLSPIDPLGYYYKMILASAYTSRGDFVQAQRLASESIALNRLHTPTWRVLISAYVLGGDLCKGKVALEEFIKLDPEFSLNSYLEAGNAESRTKLQFSAAFRELSKFI